MNKKLSIGLLIILFVLQASLVNTSASEANKKYDYKSPEFKAVASQFMCTCGCGQDHYACDMAGCANTDSFKLELVELMEQGMNKDEIREYYVNIFGEEILSAPEKKGFSLTAWVLPFVAIGGAGTGIFFFLRKFIRRRGDDDFLNQEMTEKDEVEEEILSSMIEEERKKYL